MKQREMTDTNDKWHNLFQPLQRSGLHSENACNYFWTKLCKMQSILPVAATPSKFVHISRKAGAMLQQGESGHPGLQTLSQPIVANSQAGKESESMSWLSCRLIDNDP